MHYLQYRVEDFQLSTHVRFTDFDEYFDKREKIALCQTATLVVSSCSLI